MALQQPATTQVWPYLALLAVVACNLLGNLFLKIGSGPEVGGFKLLGMFGWPTLVGLIFFGSSALFYAWSLRYIALHDAQVVVSLQFAGAILIASFFFGEAISFQKWAGLSMILAGLIVCVR